MERDFTIRKSKQPKQTKTKYFKIMHQGQPQVSRHDTM